MPRTVQKALTFPLSGVSRSRGYRDQAFPYAAPWAVNVRGVEAAERRERGGSRPGLAKVHATDFGDDILAIIPVTSVDSSGVRNRDLLVIAGGSFSSLRGSTVISPTAALVTDAGVSITTDTGDEIVFTSTVSAVNPIGPTTAYEGVERAGKVYLADATLKVYDPLTGVVAAVQASAGIVPTGCPLIALYRDRIFLAGADHIWFCSRQGDPADWALAGDMSDTGRASAGQIGRAGEIGEPITAMVPVGDRGLLFATANTLWILRGDPIDGSMTQLSSEIGIIAPGAWAESSDGTIAFLSNDGVYLVNNNGDRPTRWSEEKIPGELRNVSTSSRISMAYDVLGRGYHLFITPSSGLGSHWWLDLENKALWPVRFQTAHQPVSASRIRGSSGLSEVILGCKDGYLRKFSDAATTDDGTAITSHVLIGPFRLSVGDAADAMLKEIYGTLADNAGSVTWRIVMGDSAEAVADAGVAGITASLAGTSIVGVAASGTWAENRNKVVHVRARGPWAVIWLSSAASWAYEAITVVINQLGRLR
jgi:hypothetical protein